MHPPGYTGGLIMHPPGYTGGLMVQVPWVYCRLVGHALVGLVVVISAL